jgi:hypothetical protein
MMPLVDRARGNFLTLPDSGGRLDVKQGAGAAHTIGGCQRAGDNQSGHTYVSQVFHDISPFAELAVNRYGLTGPKIVMQCGLSGSVWISLHSIAGWLLPCARSVGLKRQAGRL